MWAGRNLVRKIASRALSNREWFAGSGERYIHTAIMAARDDVEAVAHCHPTYVTGLRSSPAFPDM